MIGYLYRLLYQVRIAGSPSFGIPAGILLLSLGFKLAVWAIVLSADPSGFLDPDSMDYHEPARALLHTATFLDSPETKIVETYRTPGYPLFLAGVYLLFGENYAAAIPVQILLSLGTMGLVYRITRNLWNPDVALVAVLLFAFDVTSFTYSLKLMTETLFTLFLVAMVAAGIHLIQSRRKKQWAWGLGVFLALATFVRPISYYLLVPLVLVFLGIALKQKWSQRQVPLILAALILPSLLLIGGWQARNYLFTGVAQYCSVEGVNLLYGYGAAIVAVQDDIDLEEAKTKLWLENAPEDDFPKSHWTTAVDTQWKQQGLRLITHNPTLFIRTLVLGPVRLMTGPGEEPLLRMLGVPIGEMGSISDYARQIENPLAKLAAPLAFLSDYVRRVENPLAQLVALLAFLYLALIYTGVLFWWWRRIDDRQINSVHLFTWMIVIYFIVISAGHWHPRFRIPIMPILVLYAAQGLSDVQSRWRRI